MKHIFTKRNIYLTLFCLLYVLCAGVSCFHAISFFMLANTLILALILAFTFEIGQAAVLFSILTSEKDRKRVMPWILMTVLTLVQVLGNVYSSYRYLILNSSENLRFFKDPVFIWMELPDNMANVILTYLIGGLLPIISLCMSAMVSNYLSDESEKNTKSDDKITEKEPVQDEVKEPIQEHVQDDIKEPIQDDVKELVKEDIQDDVQEDIKEPVQEPVQDEVKEDVQEPVQEDVQDEVKEPVKEDIQDEVKEPVKEDIQDKPTEKVKSHFINI